MTPGPLVGLVGGYGAVGRAAAEALAGGGPGRSGPIRLRVGGRRADVARRFVDTVLAGEGEAVPVDVFDQDSVARFCAGCAVVLNCAGPSYRVLDRVAGPALAAGADYVDVGGDDPLHEKLTGRVPGGRRALLSAGMLPGLSALLPKVLATRFEEATGLTGYFGGIGRFTRSAAEDFLLSLGNGYGTGFAEWRDGAVRQGSLTVLEDVELPLFPRRVTAYPFLSTELRRLAEHLGLREARWYNVFDGSAALSMLTGWQGRAATGSADDHAAAVSRLVRASEVDAAGRAPYQAMSLRMTGSRDGVEHTADAVLRAADGSRLTGTVGAITTAAALAGRVPSGLHYAADVLDPGAVLGELTEVLPEVTLREFHGTPASGAVFDEGLL
ncbi:saccharopine dehydrogenase NADP-binding domain-containing protein [Amycolatopsis sp. NPDC058986]|uniref:saccharopine dehydrogenase NADP-binding domain-containing protein n=1 Tax=unclassified Amycolatopsis TaxID=2618356 RepID=UPI00366D07E9